MRVRTTFRTKLLLLTILPLVIAQVVTLFGVMRTVENNIRADAQESLEVGMAVVGQYLAARAEQLRNSIGVLAADYGLKEATATSDAATIRSVLDNHRRRVGADVAVLLNLDGQFVAGTLEFASQDAARIRDTLNSPDRDEAEFTARIAGDSYHLFAVPLRAPVPIGWVVLGFEVNHALARRIADLTGLDVAIVSRDARERTIASTAGAHPDSVDTAQPLDYVYMASGGDDRSLTIQTPYLRGDSTILVILQRSVREAMLPYEEARRALIVFAAVLLVLVAVAAAWFSTTIAEPLRTLGEAARRMIAGNYDTNIVVGSDDEFGELASSFNAMQTAIAEREQRISHNALHDPLTDLPNRARILISLTQAIEQARSDGSHVAVLSVRLDRMDEITSTLGHSAADDLIVRAAEHLQANLGRSEMLGQTGTNEFVLVLPGHDVMDAMTWVDRIQSLLSSGVSLGRINMILQTDIGVAEFPRHGDAAMDLLRCASIARSEAEASSERVRIYQPGREDEFLRRLRIINDLPSSLRRGEVQTWFQPKVSLPSGNVCGVEALVRWTHPELGKLNPVDFIPAAEQSGTIVALTRHVLTAAVAECHAWRGAGIDVQVSVNLSARDLLDEYLPYHVSQLLKDHAVPPGNLTLEVTENMIMEDLPRARSVLEVLRDIGVRLSMDDFGTGHSSLAQLRNIPLHELKIDKSFVTSLCNDEHNDAIVRTTVELAHGMRLAVVAEGVEDESSLRRVAALGCEQAQGFFISKPMPAEAFPAWLANYEPVPCPDRRGKGRAFAAK